jgi:hypothetical protein
MLSNKTKYYGRQQDIVSPPNSYNKDLVLDLNKKSSSVISLYPQ